MLEEEKLFIKQTVSVYRNSSQSITIPVEELLVGDIYRVTTGMVIPADSILIQTGHPKSYSNLKNRSNLQQSILVLEEFVTGE